jgi:hypothetical protein
MATFHGQLLRLASSRRIIPGMFDPNFIPARAALTAAFFAPSGRAKRTRPSAAETPRLEKRRTSGRQRQERYAERQALRGDPSLNIIARAVLCELLLSDREDLVTRKPQIIRALAALEERGYRPELCLKRMFAARQRERKRRAAAQCTAR